MLKLKTMPAEAHDDPSRAPLTDPGSRLPLPQRAQPGYYPGFSTLSQKSYWDETTRKLVLNRLDTPEPLRFFTPSEAATMQAVVDRVLPQEDRTDEHRIPVLSGVDKRLAENRMDGYRFEDMPSDQQAYRMAAQAFEQMAQELHGKPFHELQILEQEELLQSVHDDEPNGAQELWKQMSVKRFWPMLVGDCASVYYAHPWAWDEIGFGGPAYPRGYMRLENGEPEPWEVDEQRYEWLAPIDTVSDQEQGSEHTHSDNTPGQGGSH